MIYRIINMANLRSNLKHLCLGSDRGNWTSQENKSTWQKWPHAFICFLIFGYCDQTLAFVFYILHTEDNKRQYTFHNHFRMAHCYLSRCNPPIKKTKRKNIFLKEEHFIHQQIMPSRSKDILHSVLALTIQDVKHLKIISVTSTDA